jgi:hypothetical protein
MGACSPAATGSESVDRLAPAPYGDLETLVRDLYIPGADSDKYVAPTAAARATFRAVLELVDRGAFTQASTRASSLGYDLWHLADPAAPGLVVVVERTAMLRGGGTFVIDSAAPSRHVVEVPHPISDGGTLEEGVQLFKSLRAGALLIAGAHRCAALASTLCVGADATNACAGRLRISDAAHFTESYFQAAHEDLFQRWAGSDALSLHTHAETTGEPAVMVSAGTRETLDGSAPANRLRDALRAAGFAAVSCNTMTDPPPRLCGESNVQGRLSNGSADACLADAVVAGARFLHVEQGVAALNASAQLVPALVAGL